MPPPQELVDGLLSDLSAFCNDDSLPAVAQAVIAHAQFETIHPFVDGNGRTGRALVHLVLRRRGLAPRVLPPISLILATWPRDYVGGLSGTRYEGAPDSEEARAGINRWIALFASACRRAAEDAERFEEQVRALQDSWRERLGSVRRGSAADLLVRALPGAPLLTATTASDLIGRSFQATSQAIDRLVGAGILTQVTVGRRNRAFEAPELIEVFTTLERQIASPEGDALVSDPLLVSGPDDLRETLRGSTVLKLVTTAVRFRPADPTTAAGATRFPLRELARRVQSLEAESKRLDTLLESLVSATAPELVASYGVGTDTASALLVSAGDNPQRLHSEAAFAHLCGVAPIDASSGLTIRKRLNRGGDRSANHALWRIVMVRMVFDARTRAYVARRTAEGRSKREIIRSLKRYVARALPLPTSPPARLTSDRSIRDEPR